MAKPNNRAALHKAVQTAFENYRKALEELAIDTVKKLALRDPASEYSFISAMGSWHFERKGLRQLTMEKDGEEGTIEEEREIEPQPAYDAFDKAEQDYGYGAVMPLATTQTTGGKVLKLVHDW